MGEWSSLTIFACAIPSEGAHPCVFYKGGWRCCRRNFCPFCANPVAHAFVVPAPSPRTRRNGAPLPGRAGEVINLGHPPISEDRCESREIAVPGSKSKRLRRAGRSDCL